MAEAETSDVSPFAVPIDNILSWLSRAGDQNRIIAAIDAIERRVRSKGFSGSMDHAGIVTQMMQVDAQLLLWQSPVAVRYLQLIQTLQEETCLYHYKKSRTTTQTSQVSPWAIKLKNMNQTVSSWSVHHCVELSSLLSLSDLIPMWESQVQPDEKSFLCALAEIHSHDMARLLLLPMLEALGNADHPISQSFTIENGRRKSSASAMWRHIETSRLTQTPVQYAVVRCLGNRSIEDVSALTVFQTILFSLWFLDGPTKRHWEIIVAGLEALCQAVVGGRGQVQTQAFFGVMSSNGDIHLPGLADFPLSRFSEAENNPIQCLYVKQKWMQIMTHLLRASQREDLANTPQITDKAREVGTYKSKDLTRGQILTDLLRFESDHIIESTMDTLGGTEHQAIVLRNLTQFPGYKEVEVVVRNLEASIQSAKKLTVRSMRTVRVLIRTGTYRDASTSTNRSRDGEEASGPKELHTVRKRGSSIGSLWKRPTEPEMSRSPSNPDEEKDPHKKMETAKRQLTNQLSLIEGAEQKLVDETTKKQKLQEKLQRKSGKKKEAAKVETDLEAQNERVNQAEASLKQLRENTEKIHKEIQTLEALVNPSQTETTPATHINSYVEYAERNKANLLHRNVEDKWMDWSVQWKRWNLWSIQAGSSDVLEEERKLWNEERRILLVQTQFLASQLSGLAQSIEEENDKNERLLNTREGTIANLQEQVRRLQEENEVLDQTLTITMDPELLATQGAAPAGPGGLWLLDYLNQWAVIFLILSFEVILCSLMVLPFPLTWRLKFSNGMSKLWNGFPRFRIVAKTLLVIVSALFLDSLRRMYTVHLSIYQPDILKMGRQTEMNMMLVSAQRNAFLCGLSVFLFMVLYRFQSMADQLAFLQTRMDQYDDKLAHRGERTLKKELNYDAGKEKIQNNNAGQTVDPVALKQRNPKDVKIYKEQSLYRSQPTGGEAQKFRYGIPDLKNTVYSTEESLDDG
ncbi:hypothetical protein PROFUN_10079 [Planoprotostelium fungivorum]|uniref:BAP29/BAP31 transmembrane domain-containing protein n=1 Tax=Planoprotostelium fungivorum TaxID=1890364 RepID=A0A2P6NEX6_9EUKA|nr:hypothetical protein PROFUN_10079 [Planoprotostelium fungivorum]